MQKLDTVSTKKGGGGIYRYVVCHVRQFACLCWKNCILEFQRLMQELPVEAADHLSEIDSSAKLVLLVANSSQDRTHTPLDEHRQHSQPSEIASSIPRP